MTFVYAALSEERREAYEAYLSYWDEGTLEDFEERGYLQSLIMGSGTDANRVHPVGRAALGPSPSPKTFEKIALFPRFFRRKKMQQIG